MQSILVGLFFGITNVSKIPKCIDNLLNMLYSLKIDGNKNLSESINNQLIKKLKDIDLNNNGAILEPGSNFKVEYKDKISYFNKYGLSFNVFGDISENNANGLSSIVCKRIPIYYPLETIFSPDFSANSIISTYIDSEPYLYPHYTCDDFNWYDFYLKPNDSNCGVVSYNFLRYLLENNPGFTVYFDNHLKYLVSGVTSSTTQEYNMFNYEKYLTTKQITYYEPIITDTISTYNVPDGFKYVSSILFDDIPGESAVILEYVNNNNTRVRCKYQYYSSIPYEYAYMSSVITDPNNENNLCYINHFDQNTEQLLTSTLSTYSWNWQPLFGESGNASFEGFASLYLHDFISSLILPEEHIRHVYNLNTIHATHYDASWSPIHYIPSSQTFNEYKINSGTLETINVNISYYSNLRDKTNCKQYDKRTINSPILLTNVSGLSPEVFGYASRISNKLF